jgi:hypothetical protein
MKQSLRKNKITAKGLPSAVVLSILIHAGIFLLAGMLVVFTVVKKKEQKFVPPKAVERPKMKLKKPKVKIKKSSRPKSTTRIVTKANRATMPDIQLPEMSGMGGGLGDGLGDGFDMMPDFDAISVFGSGQTIGNDFEGSLYSLNRDRNGRPIPMDENTFRQKLRDFVLADWNPRVIRKYYCSPTKLYTTHFMIPEIPSPMAPEVFGEPDMEAYYFFLHYKGKLVSQEPITFRFWGNGDAYMFIRVGGEEVFISCWDTHKTYFDWWQSSSADDEKYFLGNRPMTVGDWITLEPGKALDMEVILGEWKGGAVAAMLNVEVQDEEYERNRQRGPILPAFKTTEFSDDLLDEIYPLLSVKETCLTNGPVFRDYSVPDNAVAANAVKASEVPSADPDESADEPAGARKWTLENGHSFEAELVTLVHNKVSLKKPDGKMVRIPKDRFSEEDLKFIEFASPPEFDISFSKQSEARFYPDVVPEWAGRDPRPKAMRYTFSTTVKQVSTGSYNHELQAEFFAIGAEIHGDRFILLDRKKTSFTPCAENNRSVRFSGETVELPDFIIGSQHRGQKYSSFLVVVTDARGEIIAHKTPKKWLFENLENLKKVPVGKYIDETCTRVHPTRPQTQYY